MSGIPNRDSRIPIDQVDGDWIKRGRRERDARRLPVAVEEWASWPESPLPSPRVVARSGDAYLVSLDGSDEELSPSVVYDPTSPTPLSLVHTAGGHLRFLHGYAEPYEGSDEERERIEDGVRRALAREPG